MPKWKINRNPLILDERAQKLGYDSYEDYLLYSVYWAKFRLANKRTKCWVCRDTPGKSSLKLHHIHYERMGEELPEDVITACNGCHQKMHKMIFDGLAKLAYAHILLRQQFLDTKLKKSLDVDYASYNQYEAQLEGAYEPEYVPEPDPQLALWDRYYEEADEQFDEAA